MLNWFLDWEILTFIYSYMSIMAITTILAIIKNSITLMKIYTTISLCILFPTIIFLAITIFDKTFDLKQEYSRYSRLNITFGEAWCVYKDYTGEICKDYVIYVLDEQNIAEQKKREIELEKQQELEKETLRKNKLLKNYEKLIEDIKKDNQANEAQSNLL